MLSPYLLVLLVYIISVKARSTPVPERTSSNKEKFSAPLLKGAKREEVIKNSWIIVFKQQKEKSAAPDQLSIKKRKEDHFRWLEEVILSKSSTSAAAASTNSTIETNAIEAKYEINSFNAYSGVFDREIIQSISEREEVDFIEEDKIVTINDKLIDYGVADDAVANAVVVVTKVIQVSPLHHPRRPSPPPWRRRPGRPGRPGRPSPPITTVIRTVTRTATSSMPNTSTTVSNTEVTTTKTTTNTTSSTTTNKTSTAQSTITQSNAEWGLARLSQRDLVRAPYEYRYPSSSGSGIRVYVLDTGIDVGHPDFGGRAVWGENFVDSLQSDDNGHGTHVAGIVGGTKYGVAKGSQIIAVKVLDREGSGSDSGILKALNWIVQRESTLSNKRTKAIINMSLGGSFSRSLNDAVNSASQSIGVAVASGNESMDSCSTSPSSAEGAMAVMASEKTDRYASFSNWGSCSNIIAPGAQIKSTYKGGGTAVMSGTSMASPHVAGLMALYLSLPDIGDPLPKDLYSVIEDNATKDAISSVPQGTPNLLAFV